MKNIVVEVNFICVRLSFTLFAGDKLKMIIFLIEESKYVLWVI